MKKCDREYRTMLLWVKKGSSTVEAAFLLPMIMTVIVLLIYLSVFMYNRLIITETAYIAALRGSRDEWKTAGESRHKSENASNELLRSALIMTERCGRQIQVKGKKVTVTLQMTQEIPFHGLMTDFTKNADPAYSVSKSAVKQNPYLFIREYSKLRRKETDRDK